MAAESSGWFLRWMDRLPGWCQLIVVFVCFVCACAYALVVMTFVVAHVLFGLLWYFIVGLFASRQRLAILKTQDRIMNFSTASQHIADEHGWLLVCETIKGTFDMIWFDDDDRNVAMISKLPTLAERSRLDLYADDKDRRMDYYAPYHDAIEFVEENVMDIESGTGKLVRNQPGSWEGLESNPRVKVSFCFIYYLSKRPGCDWQSARKP